MIAVVVASSMLTGTVVGWFGHKASLRIEMWGRNMNEREGISSELPGQMDRYDSGAGRKRLREDNRFAPGIVNGHFPVGAIRLK